VIRGIVAKSKAFAVGILALLGGALVARSSSAGSSSPSSGPSSAGSSSSGDAFRAALVARALEDVGHVVESSPNWGPEIKGYLANVGILVPSNWCAAAAYTWIRDAARRSGVLRVLEVIKPTAGAKALADGPKARGWYVPIDVARAAAPHRLPPPGSLAIWDRSKPPGSGFEGHVGIVEGWHVEPSGPQFFSLEGNSGLDGRRVTRMDRNLADPRLLGFVVFPDVVTA
jgi:hypothetical protein